VRHDDRRANGLARTGVCAFAAGCVVKDWTVMRWSGRDGDAPRVRFIGPEEKARMKYVKLYRDMRRGTVELIDGNGEIIDRAWAPRTRW
jgi:hypothetical protein